MRPTFREGKIGFLYIVSRFHIFGELKNPLLKRNKTISIIGPKPKIIRIIFALIGLVSSLLGFGTSDNILK
tara:strand:- start:320 stop:532 length:213 start_codon:yes stop_codon:yes gene_type:complete